MLLWLRINIVFRECVSGGSGSGGDGGNENILKLNATSAPYRIYFPEASRSRLLSLILIVHWTNSLSSSVSLSHALFEFFVLLRNLYALLFWSEFS